MRASNQLVVSTKNTNSVSAFLNNSLVILAYLLFRGFLTGKVQFVGSTNYYLLLHQLLVDYYLLQSLVEMTIMFSPSITMK